MSSFMLRHFPMGGDFARIQVFMGPDEDHRHLTGELIFRKAQADEFMATMTFGVERTGGDVTFKSGTTEEQDALDRARGEEGP